MAEPLVYSFGKGASEGDPTRVDLLGGKGASLAAMSRAGFPVPPGFTISASCCAYVEREGRWPPGLENEVRQALARLETVTQRRFGEAPRPLLVAVRSGAPVSMPGMMDTILNCGLSPALLPCYESPDKFWAEYADYVRMFAASALGLALQPEPGATAEDAAKRFLQAYEFPNDPWQALVACIDAVFASWRSERAAAYRARHGITDVTGTAVNVQMMFPSERSGVLFTVNPNDPAAGEMVLEASWGLGEAVVSGAVTPDIYVLDSQTLALKRTTPGDRPGIHLAQREEAHPLAEREGYIHEPALSPVQIHELCRLGREVEAHFGVPSDIEWGLCEGEFAVLQTRAIRGLDVLADAERGRQEEIARLQTLADGKPAVWVVHNLAETLPAPTPLTWSLIRKFMSGRGGFGRLYKKLGYRPSGLVDREGFLELICGRIYVDPVRAAGLFWEGLPFEYDAAEILRDRQSLERPPAKFNPERADALFLARLPGTVLAMLRSARTMRRLGREAQDRYQREVVDRMELFLATCSGIDLGKLPTGKLLSEFESRREFTFGDWAAETLLPGFFGGLAHQRLGAQLTQLLGPARGEELLARLTTGLENDITVEQNLLLFRVARGETSWDDFLNRFGHRANGEMELAEPRWREDRNYLEHVVAGFRGGAALSPEERHARQVEIRRHAEGELPRLLADAGGASLREPIERDLREVQALLPYRELGKYHLMRAYAALREPLVELGRRWELGRELFFLESNELSSFETQASEYRQRIAARKLRWKSAQKLVLPDVIDSSKLAQLGLSQSVEPADSSGVIEARAIASGVGVGVARIVYDPREAGELGHDYILVCPSTDPGWTPLFVHAKGLVVERGGVLSHGAIVARDFGLPAVVLEDATRRIPVGAKIEVDGNRGRVVRLGAS